MLGYVGYEWLGPTTVPVKIIHTRTDWKRLIGPKKTQLWSLER